MPIQTSMEQIRWLRFKNSASETAPPYAVMKVTGAVAIEGVMVLTVDKPDGTGGVFALNGKVAIPHHKYGRCTLDTPWQARYSTGDGVPAAGEVWGPTNNSWALAKEQPGFIVLSPPISNVAGIVPVHNMSGGSADIIRFETTADKDYGANVIGEKLELVLGVYAKDGVTIGLVDPWQNLGQADEGARGWAIRMKDRPTVAIGPHDDLEAYEILTIQAKARFGYATLSQSMQSGSPPYANASFTLSDFFGNPDNGLAPTAITVYDPQSRYLDALSGAKCMVVLNEIEDRYEILRCDQLARFVEVTLTQFMGQSVANQAAATINDYFGGPTSPQSPGASITIYDPQSLFTRALSGAKALAVYDEADNRYELIRSETKAEQVDFTLTENMGASNPNEATATIDDYYRGQSPGTPIMVRDVQGLFPRALNNAKGLATYDDRSNDYHITACDQECWLVATSLGANLCPTDGAATIGSITLMLGPPFSQTPTIATVANTYGCAGESGDACILIRNHTSSDWAVLTVAHKELEVMTDFIVDAENMKLQKMTRTIAAMYCDDEVGPTDLHTGTDCQA